MTPKELAEFINGLKSHGFFRDLSDIEIKIVDSILNDPIMTSKTKGELIYLFFQHKNEMMVAQKQKVRCPLRYLYSKIKNISKR